MMFNTGIFKEDRLIRTVCTIDVQKANTWIEDAVSSLKIIYLMASTTNMSCRVPGEDLGLSVPVAEYPRSSMTSSGQLQA